MNFIIFFPWLNPSERVTFCRQQTDAQTNGFNSEQSCIFIILLSLKVLIYHNGIVSFVFMTSREFKPLIYFEVMCKVVGCGPTAAVLRQLYFLFSKQESCEDVPNLVKMLLVVNPMCSGRGQLQETQCLQGPCVFFSVPLRQPFGFFA